ncbi:MAG: trehalase family glycosidase [Puia sp.]|nr:trehalase family glycosidase [Puia sp.]
MTLSSENRIPFNRSFFTFFLRSAAENSYLFILPVLFVLVQSFTAQAQPVERRIRTEEYRQLQRRLASGWNTWYNNSILSWVLLPESFSINLCVDNYEDGDFLREAFKAQANQHRPEQCILGLRADDGSYTSLRLIYKGVELSIQSATDGSDELILVTPEKPSKQQLVIEAGIQFGRQGQVSLEGAAGNQKLVYHSGGRNLEVGTTGALMENGYVVSSVPHLGVSLQGETGIYTGKGRSLEQIREIVNKRRAEQQQRVDSYGELSESFKAMQTILAWNTIYDAPNDRVMTPVSRLWNRGWGGFVLFDWDTYFASVMCSLFNKDLAYANAVEITKAISAQGFIPNYQAPFGNYSWDRSEPPVGAVIVLDIYKRYHEKWFLEEVYDELLTWNRWWSKCRSIKGYLAWGSDDVADSLRTIDKFDLQAAKFESGLDNSPMYDGVPFNKTTHTMELADVGLMSLYVADCNALQEMATVLGKKADIKELSERSARYKKSLASLWDEEKGIFVNKRTDTDEKSYRLSPTNFYPMLAKACTQRQAERMIREHYFNSNEFYGEFVIPSIARNDPAFKDNDYWRGRIWGPMNFLLYLGMRNYDLPEARADLVKKSGALLMKSWKANGAIYENYNGATGQGDDVGNADGFYHWGALLSFMSFLEKDNAAQGSQKK